MRTCGHEETVGKSSRTAGVRHITDLLPRCRRVGVKRSIKSSLRLSDLDYLQSSAKTDKKADALSIRQYGRDAFYWKHVRLANGAPPAKAGYRNCGDV
jgi:hypothetical protein